MKLIQSLIALAEAKAENLVINTRAGKASAERKAETELRDRLNRIATAEAQYAADIARLENKRQARHDLIEYSRKMLAQAQHEIDILSECVYQSKKELEDAEKALSSFGG